MKELQLKLSQTILASVKLVVFDFDGVFTDNMVYVNQDGMESVRCNRSDGLGLSRLRSIGIQTIIMSTETNAVVKVRSQKLNIQCKQAIADKALAILDTCRELGIAPKDTVFVGNDINDIAAFNTVGIPIAVADAYPEVMCHVMYQTAKAGGQGAVREVCDLIFDAKTQQLPGASAHAN